MSLLPLPQARIIRVATLLFASLLTAGSAVAELNSVSLAWDSSPEADVTSYRIYYGTESQVYSDQIDVVGATQVSLTNLSASVTYFTVVTAINSAGLESLPSNEISFVTDAQTETVSGQLIFIEAESGNAVAPMAAENDPAASFGQFVEASGPSGEGILSLSFDAPAIEPYYAWCRVLAPSGGNDSFYVSINGQDEFVYHIHGAATPIGQPWSNDWLWTLIVNDDGSPKALSVEGGLQDLVFRTREPSTGLDRVILTSDPNFVPDDNTPMNGDFVAITSQPETRLSGDTLELYVATAATGETTYQWFKNGNPIPGATGSAHDIGVSGDAAVGEYHVVATSGGFSIASEPISITPQVGLQLAVIRGTGGTSSRIDLQVTGPLYQVVVVEHSVDLIQWQYLEELEIGPGSNQISDFDSFGSVSRKFYRVVPIEP